MCASIYILTRFLRWKSVKQTQNQNDRRHYRRHRLRNGHYPPHKVAAEDRRKNENESSAEHQAAYKRHDNRQRSAHYRL